MDVFDSLSVSCAALDTSFNNANIKAISVIADLFPPFKPEANTDVLSEGENSNIIGLQFAFALLLLYCICGKASRYVSIDDFIKSARSFGFGFALGAVLCRWFYRALEEDITEGLEPARNWRDKVFWRWGDYGSMEFGGSALCLWLFWLVLGMASERDGGRAWHLWISEELRWWLRGLRVRWLRIKMNWLSARLLDLQAEARELLEEYERD